MKLCTQKQLWGIWRGQSISDKMDIYNVSMCDIEIIAHWSVFWFWFWSVFRQVL
jgi:hypothetical protein